MLSHLRQTMRRQLEGHARIFSSTGLGIPIIEQYFMAHWLAYLVRSSRFGFIGTDGH
jgi:hypothetical protein